MNSDEIPVQAWTIVDSIRRRGAAPRSQIVMDTGLPWATINRLANILVQRGFVLDDAKMRFGKSGPESKLLQISPEVGRIIGIDVSGKRIKAEVVDLNFRSVDLDLENIQNSCSIGNGTITSLLEHLRKLLSQIIDKVSVEQILAIGLAWPGAIDVTRNLVRFDPRRGFDYPLKVENMFYPQDYLKLQSKGIVVEHDAKCAAIAEKEIGAIGGLPREETSFATIIVGEGVGAGLVLDGSLYRGVNNYSGEIGHCPITRTDQVPCSCGRVNCLEKFVSSSALLEQWSELHKSTKTRTLSDIVSAAKSGNRDAITLFSVVGERLGEGLTPLINLLNVELIVLLGEVSQGYMFLEPSLQKTLETRSWKYSMKDLRIEESNLGERAIAVGAAIAGYRRLLAP